MSNGRRPEKPTRPQLDLARLGRRVHNLAFEVAHEAQNQLLELGKHKAFAELAKKTVDFSAAVEAYNAYQQAAKPKR